MEEKIGYKVVRIRDNNFISAVNTRTPYNIGEATIRKEYFGPFAVFNSFEKAFAWREQVMPSIKSAILKVIYTPSKDTCLWYDSRVTVWINRKLHIDGAPDGTIFADTVIPIKVII